jgi:hypothetical protein
VLLLVVRMLNFWVVVAGSGKSYTMFGPPGAPPDREGIIPRLGHELFSRLLAMRAKSLEGRVEVTYLQVSC